MPLGDLIRNFNSHGDQGDSILFADGTRVAAWHQGLRLGSWFQPIIDPVRNTVVGHEAFLYAGTIDRQPLATEDAFALAGDPDSVVRFDRLCRTLHALNFLAQRRHAGGYLYLNVHPRHLLAVPCQHGLIFEAILKRCGLGPEDTVLELDAARVNDDARLLEAITAYRQRGYRIALDRFGRETCDCTRLEVLRPDIVKLHRELPALAVGQDREASDDYPRLVAAAHAIGAIAVAQGIETPAELEYVRAAGADLVQGFLLGVPQPDCVATHGHCTSRPAHPTNGVPS